MKAQRKARIKWASFLALLLVLLLALSACERQLQGLLDDNGNTEAGPDIEQPGADNEVDGEGEAEMGPGLDAATAEPEALEAGEDEAAAGDEEPVGEEDQPVTGIPADDPKGATAIAEAAVTAESPRPAEEGTAEAGETGEATATPGEAAAEEMAEEQPPASPEATGESPNEPTEEAVTTAEATEEAPAETAEEATPEATKEVTEDAAGEEATAEATAETTEATDEEAGEAAQTTASGEERIHIVQRGENLYRIGLQYGISWAVLAQVNNLPNANAITVGQQLRIPADPNAPGTPTPTPAPKPTETTYVVQPGDTLARIARSFALTWQEIAEANGLVNPNRIYVGQELKIPGSAPAPQLTHTVQPRETLYLIALRYGVPWASIASANKLAAPYVIYPGQILIIPGDSQ